MAEIVRAFLNQLVYYVNGFYDYQTIQLGGQNFEIMNERFDPNEAL